MARKRRAEEAAKGDDSFALMFTSLNLILLSFFILLNSISIKDSARSRNALGSLRGTFGILTGGENPWSDGKELMKSDVVETAKTKGRDLVADKIAMVVRRGLFAGAPTTLVVRTADGVRLELTEKVAFRPGRTEIHPRLFPLLDEVAKLIKKIKRTIVVQGYADGAPPRAYPSNLTLSAVRAAEVARYFVQAANVAPELVRAEGRGVRSEGDQQRVVKILIPTRSLRARLGGGA